MTTSTRIGSSPSTFQLVSLPGQLEPLSEQPPEIRDDEPIFLECGICFENKHFDERQTLPHENYDPQDHAKRCFGHEKRLYCSACVEKLPSPKTCPMCRTSIITEIAVQAIPEAAPTFVLLPQAPILENVVVIHYPIQQQIEEKPEECSLVDYCRYLRQRGILKRMCLSGCVILGFSLFFGFLGAHGYLKT